MILAEAFLITHTLVDLPGFFVPVHF